MKYINSGSKKYLPLIFSLLLFSNAVFCQTEFIAFPKGNSEKYHLDFKVFYQSGQDAVNDFNKLKETLDKLFLLKGKSTQSAENLLNALQLNDSIQIKYVRLYNYYDLLSRVNREDKLSPALRDNVYNAVNIKSAFFDRELSDLTTQKIDGFTKEKKALYKYSHFLSDHTRLKQHMLSDSIEDYLAKFGQNPAGWQYDLFETIVGNCQFGDISIPGGKLNSRKDRTLIETNSDSSVRSSGFRKYYDGLNASRSLFAFCLINLVRGLDQSSKAHGFDDAAGSFYFNKYYSKTAINKLLNQIADSARIYKHYQEIRRDYLDKKQSLKGAVHLWDMKLSANNVDPRFDIDTATTIILKALSPLGDEFKKELYSLLDPDNGRMEVAGAVNKRSANFSSGFIGSRSVFYAWQYLGTYNDIRVLTHEGSHAVHRELMNVNHVLPGYAVGPNYLFESFAIFSEFLLSDYLINTAATDEEKRFYLEKYFDGKGMALFSIAQDALLEQAIHEGVVKGRINNADDLNAVNAAINKKFSIWSTSEYPQQNLCWITNSLFYEDPFYNVNYVLGAIIALKFYDLYKKDDCRFQKNYITLLKNGFTKDPAPLLLEFLKIDITSPELLNNAVEIIKGKVSELEILYKK